MKKELIVSLIPFLFSLQLAHGQDVFEAPSITAKKIAELSKTGTVKVLEEKWTVDPGEGLIEGKPFLESIPNEHHSKFKPGTHIKIFEYTGEGWSIIELNGKRFSTKIARSIDRCKKGSDVLWRECWAKVLKEPTYIRWKKVKLPNNKTGWIIEEKLLANYGLHFPGALEH